MEMGHFHVPKAPLINHKVPIDEGGKNASITLFFRRKDDYVPIFRLFLCAANCAYWIIPLLPREIAKKFCHLLLSGKLMNIPRVHLYCNQNSNGAKWYFNTWKISMICKKRYVSPKGNELDLFLKSVFRSAHSNLFYFHEVSCSSNHSSC